MNYKTIPFISISNIVQEVKNCNVPLFITDAFVGASTPKVRMQGIRNACLNVGYKVSVCRCNNSVFVIRQ